MAVVHVESLWKRYGDIEALRGVTLDVEPGQIFGLLGQNGAGKSTLLKILLGIVRKTEGEATLLGAPAGDVDTRRLVGYLPEDHLFPGYHSATSLLDFYGRLYGLGGDCRKRIDEALEIVGLTKRRDYKIRTYSKGMKQRLGIAQAFFHEPQVIFLDEPTDGVDPVGRKEIRDLLMRLRSEGRTIFFNSHLLSEVEMIADRVAILHQGELVRLGTVADLTQQTDLFAVGLAKGDVFPAEELARLGFKPRKTGETYEIEVPGGKTIDDVLAFFYEKRLKIRHLVEKKLTLEDVFVSVVEKPPTAAGVSARRHEK